MAPTAFLFEQICSHFSSVFVLFLVLWFIIEFPVLNTNSVDPDQTPRSFCNCPYYDDAQIRRKGWRDTTVHVQTVELITLARQCEIYSHYENMTIQMYWKFYHLTMKNFQIKNSDIFHISAQNTDCGYSLEPPRRGGSNEYPQSMF